MAMEWSDEQKRAIKQKGKDCLVSAGAGSGKTAVLTERIYRLVKEGSPISKFLVLTFTDAAASEMKDRVRGKLLADPSLSSMAVEIENSHIETFDAFALFIVKKYAYELGLSKEVSILDNNILEIKTRKVIDEYFDELYESKDKLFKELILRYCHKDDKDIKELIFQVLKTCDLEVDKYAYLNEHFDRYFNIEKLNKLIDERFKYLISVIQKVYDGASTLENTEDGVNIQAKLAPYLAAKDYDELYNLLSLDKPGLPTKKGKNTSDGDFRDSLKNAINAILPKKEPFGHKDEIINEFLSSKPYVEKIIDISKEVMNRLDAFKNSINSYSFNDIAKYALKALKDEVIRKEMMEAFDFIMVDEYQDTSDLQEEVINLLDRNNVYMVGDIKQSIYRFRNANCDIFQKKYDDYKADKGGEEIDLNTSYRSRKEVVNLINEVFSKLMRKEFNPIDYSNGHHFGYGFKAYDSLVDDTTDFEGYDFKIVTYIPNEGEEKYFDEAHAIVFDILNKVGKTLTYDKDLKQMRPSMFKDFAVITQTKTNYETYRKVFSKFGVPLRVVGQEKFKETDISYVTKNLLTLFNCIVNDDLNEDFKHAFVSIARSFLIELPDKKIFEIVKENKYKEVDFVDRIYKDGGQFKHLSNFEILNYLYNIFDLYVKVIKIGAVNNNIHKAEYFLDLAKNFDKIGFSISDFVKYFDDIEEFDLDIEISDLDITSDAVTLISAHKSKGLEYPFCFFPEISQTYYFKENRDTFFASKDYGIILPFTGSPDLKSYFIHLVRSKAKRETMEEKIRLFYVALTRARESITTYIPVSEKDKPILEFEQCTSWEKLLRFIDALDKYAVLPPLLKERQNIVEEEQKFDTAEIVNINALSEVIGSYKKASKEVVDDVDDELLDFGTKLHYLLEVSNYETKDTNFIKEPLMKKYVNNVLNCGLFENVKNSQVLHEYYFTNEQNNTNGIIDCMVIKEDEIDIIDFKLKKINDEKYNKQLNIYADYVTLLSDKKIKLYLISSITGEVKEVERTQSEIN